MSALGLLPWILSASERGAFIAMQDGLVGLLMNIMRGAWHRAPPPLARNLASALIFKAFVNKYRSQVSHNAHQLQGSPRPCRSIQR